MMKKIITLLAILLGTFTTGAKAQQYQKGDILVNAGLSLGAWGYGYGLYGSSSGFLPLTASVEYSLDDKFSFGPYAGIYSRSYSYLTYQDRFTALSFGGRGTLHLTSLLKEHLDLGKNEEKLDVYASLIVGLEVRRWSYDSSYEGDHYYSNHNSIDFGPVLGVRYKLSPSVGAFLEAGRGAYGLGTLGMSAKF